MRILRISLKDYRGVVDRTIEFAPTGVTVVEGPNEIGKSSLAEAIDRIIEDLDSSGRSRVLALKPVDRDVGPEVTMEVESGPYAFTYRKRFLRQPETELHVHRPTPEHLAGLQAHERAEAILSETVDMALWKALRLQQGNRVGQAELGDKASLALALERAAGEVPAGEQEVSLLRAAQAAFLGSWTEAGRKRKDAQQLETAAEQATERAQELETALSAIESDIDASESLEARIRELTEHREAHRSSVEAYRQRVDGLRWTEMAVEAAVQRHANATLAATEARRVATARRDLIAAVEMARAEAARQATSAGEDAERLRSARGRTSAADAALLAARADRDLARARANAAQARITRDRDIAELLSLEERYRRGSEASEMIQAALADASLPVTAEGVARLREEYLALERARARLGTAHPYIRLEAQANIQGAVDGIRLALGPGRSIEQPITQGLWVEFPGVLRLAVAPGPMPDEDVDLPAMEARFTESLRALGAADGVEAEQLLVRKTSAERTVAEQQRILGAVLEGWTAPALAERIGDLRAAVQVPLMPGAVDPLTAQQALADAEQRMFAAEHEWQAAHQQLNELERTAEGMAAQARLTAEELARLEATLASERATWPDESVDLDLANAEAHEASVGGQLASAREQLAALDADQARELLDNAEHVLARLERDTRAAQDRLLEVTTRLRDHQEDGVEEDLLEARMVRDDAAQTAHREDAQAAAQRLLFETLTEDRDRASRSYVGPLRKEMERLGKIVFGRSFSLELDGSTLEVVSRTLGGRRIPFESLSIGAQEQIAIIGRLAGATLVAPDGGVPVILDDALGYSDPRRVESMGAVLAAAGRSNQIIVLTCQPGRYEHVGDARVVPIG